MPANNVKTQVKQFLVRAPALERITGIMAVNEKRNMLEIQNNGANPLLYRFDEDVQLDGSDRVIIPGDYVIYQEPCPIGRVSFYSVAGTIAAVIEGFDV